jgi:hypothetical protein
MQADSDATGMISDGYLVAGFNCPPVRHLIGKSAITVHHGSNNQEQAGTENKKQFENTFHRIFPRVSPGSGITCPIHTDVADPDVA